MPPIPTTKVSGVETSYGKNNVLSSAGAAGIMQVMPGTARDVAKEIGDPNFNPNWTDAEVQNYLQSNNDIGNAYGKAYFGDMLKK